MACLAFTQEGSEPWPAVMEHSPTTVSWDVQRYPLMATRSSSKTTSSSSSIKGVVPADRKALTEPGRLGDLLVDSLCSIDPNNHLGTGTSRRRLYIRCNPGASSDHLYQSGESHR